MIARTPAVVVLAVVLAAAVAVTSLLPACSKAPKGAAKAGFNPEFLARPDGWDGVKKVYNFRFAAKPVMLQSGRMYKACADGDVDVISAFATDGRIRAYDLLVLEDDKNAFPPYDAVPIARRELLDRYPFLRDVVGRLSGKIDTETMRKLNLSVDREDDYLRPEEAARKFLEDNGYLDDRMAPTSPEGTVRVGSKNFTEQRILSSILEQLIEHHTNLTVDRISNLSSDRINPALRNDELDLYVEYTGTGLINVLKLDPMSDAEKVYDLVKGEFQDKWNVVWMEPLGFDNSYTLTMRKAHAEKLGIKTISDLAEYVRTHAGSAAE